MNRSNIPLTARGLTTYAIERQHSYERHQPEGSPSWAERRRFWIDAILQGMARLEGGQADPKLMERSDLELEQAQGCCFIVPATWQMQRDTIRELRRFVTALEDTGDDRRCQVDVVRELLEDMASHLPWALTGNGLSYAMDETESALVRMTARMPIRFTRILLGGDAGPHRVSGFAAGAVTDAEAVKRSSVYQDAVQDHPEVQNWPTLCTDYVGHGSPYVLGTVDASDFDLEIIARTGDRFLKRQDVRCVGGPYQMTISTAQAAVDQTSIQYPFLQGSRPLTAEDLDIQERLGTEDGWITFCLDVLADEDTVFGRRFSDEDAYIQAYTSYNERTGQVDDTLDIVVRSSGSDEWFSCVLTDDTRKALKQKMDTFCMEMYGEHLPGPSVQCQDSPAPPWMEPMM